MVLPTALHFDAPVETWGARSGIHTVPEKRTENWVQSSVPEIYRHL